MKGKGRFYLRYLLGAAAVLGSGLAGALLPAALTSEKIGQFQLATVTQASPEQRLQVHQTMARLPLLFIENRGQAAPGVQFYALGRGQAIAFTRQGLHFSLTGRQQPPTEPDPDEHKPALPPKTHRPTPCPPPKPGTGAHTIKLSLTPLGLSRNLELAALDPLETKVNYCIGNDPNKWHTDLPTYQAVVYKEAYPGIDLKFYGAGGQLEYDIIVKPGADPNRVTFNYTGVTGLKITPAGDLAIRLPDGSELVQKKPVVYQEINGVRVPREARFNLCGTKAQHTFGFQVAAYDHKHPLVIDPVLVYSTYWGGNVTDKSYGIALDAAGNAYVTGVTWSTTFGGGGGSILAPSPGSSNSSEAVLSPLQGICDIFVIKISPYGRLWYFTLLGGSGSEEGHGIAADAGGNAYVTGWTDSADFPCLNTDIAQSGRGGKDAFVARLRPSGVLDWSTVLGGVSADGGSGIALGSLAPGSGLPYVFVSGWTNSETWGFSPQAPLTPLNPYNSGGDAFVVTIPQYTVNQTTRVYASSYCLLGGSGKDEANGIALDEFDNAYITGVTFSTDMPVYPASYAYHGAGDAFVAKISNTGVKWSICLGGSSTDLGNAIAVDANNSIYIVGETYSSSFAGLTPSFSDFKGGEDAFVMKIRQIPTFPSGQLLPSPSYFTFLGGSGTDIGRGIGVDGSGNAYVTGETGSPNFPLVHPLPNASAWTDAFVAKLNATGTALVYSTRLGGGYSDTGNAIAVQPDGVALVTGTTDSLDFPTRAAVYNSLISSPDVFVTKLAPQPLIRAPLPGLLAFYPFPSYWEIGQDASGHGRDAVPTDVSELVAFTFEGKSSGYNGTSSFLRAPLNINPSQCPTLTMGAWARVYQSPTRRMQVLSCDNGGYDRSLGIDYSGGTAFWAVFCGSSGLRLGPPVVLNQWVFLAAVYDQPAGTVTFWVNDQKLTVTGASLGEGFNILDIGRNPGYGEYLNGFLDNVFIYERALNDAQITYIQEGGANTILTAPRAGSVAPGLLLLQ